MSDVGRCQDCKYWSDRDFEIPGVADFEPMDTGFCTLAVSVGAIAKHPHSLAVAADHEGYKAVLITRSTFGCVQFEPRPQ